jgi:hypothetical protein
MKRCKHSGGDDEEGKTQYNSFLKIIYLLFKFYFIVLHILTCAYIIWATIHLPASGQKLFRPLVLSFCWRKNITVNKKNTAFLLVWDKDRYTGRFFVLFLCKYMCIHTYVYTYIRMYVYICTYIPKLVHLYQTCLLLPSPFP